MSKHFRYQVCKPMIVSVGDLGNFVGTHPFFFFFLSAGFSLISNVFINTYEYLLFIHLLRRINTYEYANLMICISGYQLNLIKLMLLILEQPF